MPSQHLLRDIGRASLGFALLAALPAVAASQERRVVAAPDAAPAARTEAAEASGPAGANLDAEPAESGRDGPSAGAPIRQLGTVEVNAAGGVSSLPSQVPAMRETITGGEVETRLNATDSEDALRYFPSLLVRKRYVGDYNHAVLSTRASGTGNSARSLVYADGILLSNLLGNGATFTPRWGLVTPEEILRVDVLYGPFSAAYPGNSAGAVVDYVTRMPTRFEAHAKIGAFTQPFALYDTKRTYNGTQASVSLGDRAGPWSWWVDVNRLDSEGQPLSYATRVVAAGSPAPSPAATPVGGAVADRNRTDQDIFVLGSNTQYHTVQDHAKLKLRYELGPGLKASYTLGLWHNVAAGQAESYLRDDAGNPFYAGAASFDGRVYGAASGAAARLGVADFPLSREELEHTMHALSVKGGAGRFEWEATGSRYVYGTDRVRSNTTTLPGAEAGGPGRVTDQRGTGWSTLAVKGTWRPDGADGAQVSDAGLQRDRFALRNRVATLAGDWIEGGDGPVFSRAEGGTELTSAWAQHAAVFATDWKVFVGGRWERWRAFDGLTQSVAPSTVATTAAPDCDASIAAGFCTRRHPTRAASAFSPKAALARQLGDEVILKVSTGRAVRFPTVSELYQGSFDASGVFQNGDPTLKPEVSWTTELGAEWTRDRQHLRATVFHESTKDALYSQTNTTVTPNVTNVQNVDEVGTWGLELVQQTQDLFVKGLDLSTSLTYADSKVLRNDKFPASVGKWQIRVPRWRAALLASWRATDALTATLGARYSGRQYSTLDNSDPNGFTFQGASRFLTADLRLHYRLTKQWSAAFGIDNLNDARYWNFHPYPQRTWNAELRFDL